MKVNLKKIIVVCFSVCICISLLAVNVFADDYSGITGIVQNDVDCITSVLNVVKDVLSGEKSVQEGYSAIQAIGNRVVKQNVKDVLTLPYNSETELNGVTPRDFADKITTNVREGLRDLGGDISDNTITTDNIDTYGYGAIMRFELPNSSLPWNNYYCDYIVITVSNGSIRSATFYGSNNIHTWNDKYTGDKSDTFKDGFTFTNTDILNSVGDYTTKFYGDIRYDNGSQADDIKSPTQSISQGIDTSQMSDGDLIELLQDMIDKINLQFPDLSTVEGLLRSILNQTTAINNKISNGENADYSDIQKYIDTAIASLSSSNGENTAAIIDELSKLRLATGGGSL